MITSHTIRAHAQEVKVVTHNSKSDLPLVLVDFEVNQTKIKGGCQSGRKVVTYNSKSDLPLNKISKISQNYS